MVDPGVLRSHNPFVRPEGLLGHLAGWVMGRDDRPHREVADLLTPRPGATVCEIGFGPGQLLAVLAAADASLLLCGVDPSSVMLAQARNRLSTVDSEAARAADLRIGAAGDLPFDDASADHVVAVNNVAMWPDLRVGLAETHRVLRVGGDLLLAWHSATAPGRIARRLARSETWWAELAAAVRREFGDVERRDLTYATVCTATKLP
jgi:ubiquinone/menaquinone biosynthesis C-methylase UbiE